MLNNFVLFPPKYKLWDYEIMLRQKEIESLSGIAPEQSDAGIWILKQGKSSQIDCLRRLAFTHSFMSHETGVIPTWQALLENGSVSTKSAKKESNYLTHGLHPYKGKFYPQLAKALINIAGLQPGQTVLDVFCGSGTTVLEGYLSGLTSIGCDFNPLAAKIASIKSQVLSVDPAIRENWFDIFASLLNETESAHKTNKWLETYTDEAQKEIISWFPNRVIHKIALIWFAINEVSNSILQDYLKLILSSIVRQISQQEPRDLRIRRRKPPIDDAPVLELLKKTFTVQRQKLIQFDKLRNLFSLDTSSVKVWNGDSRYISNYLENGVQPASIDAIITSPPYATALPYIDTDRLSILLIFGMTGRDRSKVESELTGTREISPSSRKSYDKLIENRDFGRIRSKAAQEIITMIHTANAVDKVGFRRKNRAALLYKYFTDMTQVLETVHEVLKPSGQAFFVLGNNMTKIGEQWVELSSTDVLKDIANCNGWQLIDEINISVTRENYAHAKNAITENSILWFKK